MRAVRLMTLIGFIACTGCTTVALNEYTERQVQSSGYCRDEAVLNCLAAVADDANTLPSFGLYSVGITTFTDSVTLGHTVTWGPLKYTMQALALTGARTPKPQWTFDPTVEYEKLTALHIACLWGLYGRDHAAAQYPGTAILEKQEDHLDQKPHFAVAERLAQLPPGWVRFGSERDVPACARYKGHKGKTWVWVMPDEHEAFAQFTLALQHIATLDISGYYSDPLVVVLATNFVTRIPDQADKTKATTILTQEYRYIKREYKEMIEDLIRQSLTAGEPLKLTRAQWLAYTEVYTGVRSTATSTPATSLSARAPTAPSISAPPGQPPGINRLPAPPAPVPLSEVR